MANAWKALIFCEMPGAQVVRKSYLRKTCTPRRPLIFCESRRCAGAKIIEMRSSQHRSCGGGRSPRVRAPARYGGGLGELRARSCASCANRAFRREDGGTFFGRFRGSTALRRYSKNGAFFASEKSLYLRKSVKGFSSSAQVVERAHVFRTRCAPPVATHAHLITI
jgi:hypothetical protein